MHISISLRWFNFDCADAEALFPNNEELFGPNSESIQFGEGGRLDRTQQNGGGVTRPRQGRSDDGLLDLDDTEFLPGLESTNVLSQYKAAVSGGADEDRSGKSSNNILRRRKGKKRVSSKLNG